jgi:UDP-glucose 4-epimerase
VPIEFVPARPGDYRGREVSAAKAERVLGWSATTSFEEGMREYVQWWMNQVAAHGERASEA